MEYSCESVSYSAERRPTSGKFVELHVLYVPDEQWNSKLNTVPVEAIENFISAGFIRLYPDISLTTVREELVNLLGPEKSIDKFSFLKCVGRSLALVKAKQERYLKVKSFAPPYAPQPELFLLPMENDGSVCSQSLTTDTHSYFTDPQTPSTDPPKKHSVPTRTTKEPVKLPQIPQSSRQQPPPPPSPDEEEEEDSYSFTDSNEEEPPSSSQKPGWPENEPSLRKTQTRGTYFKPNTEAKEPAPVQVTEADAKAENTSKRRQRGRRNQARDSGVPESLEGRDSDFSLTQDRFRKSQNIQTLKYMRNQPKSVLLEHPALLSAPAQYTSPPLPPTLAMDIQKTSSHVFPTSRDELIEEIKLVKDERKQLERTRQELLRKGKDLLAQNRHRRNQARDTWKKRYFETKKATAPLEETLRNIRQELETFYNKLLHQLQARDWRGKARHQGRSSTKNEIIIQIMTESHEIDNLKRKVDDAKMKLVTEIKLRKQAATELRALRAELAQKKTQTSHSGPR
ncbi:spermatogenesis-associated protein 1 [Osmerus mordax]|uniref:spermatogenesis-associated protein 1 n=1 Tax=Osmerus mordax TaxID=8014 RepID=UPI00350EDCDE